MRLGEPPPDVEWISTKGDTLSWDDLRGGAPLVVVFWASWCKVCRKEWPELRKVAAGFGDGPAVPVWIPVSLDRSPAKAEKAATEWELPGKLFLDTDETIAKALGVRYVPTVCILDPAGRVAYAGKPDARKIRSLLRDLTPEVQERVP